MATAAAAAALAKRPGKPPSGTAEAAAHARALVDRYGAQNFDGAGAIIAAHGGFENTYRAFVKELYDYSSKVYSRL